MPGRPARLGVISCCVNACAAWRTRSRAFWRRLCCDSPGAAAGDDPRQEHPRAHRPRQIPHHTVGVGKATVTIAAGKTKTITIKLNRTGRRLLAKFKKLPLTLTADVQPSTVATTKLTLEPPASRPHPRH
jgi:hypothetical protein